MINYLIIYFNTAIHRGFVFTLLFFTLLSCSIQRQQPIKTFEKQKIDRNSYIEDTLSSRYDSSNYKSLAFGKLTVYKPESFVRLDSLYALKEGYIENRDYRGLRKSGIEESIPAYRAEAQNDLEEVNYEIEHVYQVNDDRLPTIMIHHDYFLFDYKDSLISISPVYHYTIKNKNQEFNENYLLEYHFITPRELYISRGELDFIRFFKNREQQLATTEHLQAFMTHTMQIMTFAREAHSVDFREISKFVVMSYFKNLLIDATPESFSPLLVLEDENENVLGYERSIKWRAGRRTGKSDSQELFNTTFSLSPYLEINNVVTKQVEK